MTDFSSNFIEKNIHEISTILATEAFMDPILEVWKSKQWGLIMSSDPDNRLLLKSMGAACIHPVTQFDLYNRLIYPCCLLHWLTNHFSLAIQNQLYLSN